MHDQDVAAALAILERLAAVQPSAIVVLGRTAARMLREAING
jgi:hypothetical protein